MKILSLDLGTQTGFALSLNGLITSGSVSFHRYAGCKSKPADHVGASILFFHKWLRANITDYAPNCIAYEAVYRWSSSSAARAYGAFLGIALLNAAAYNIPCYGYSPTQIKKAYTGNGNAKKEVMMKESTKRFPAIAIRDDNHADALAILSLHLSYCATD